MSSFTSLDAAPPPGVPGGGAYNAGHMDVFDELNPPARLLLGPGPSPVHPRVMRALGAPVLGHLDPELLRLLDETRGLLRGRLPHVQRADPRRVGHRHGGHGVRAREPPRARATAWSCARRASSATAWRSWPGAWASRSRRSRRSGARCSRPRRSRPRWRRRSRRPWPSSTPRPRPAPSSRWTASATIAHRHDALLIVDCVTSLGGAPVVIDGLGRGRRLLGLAEVPRAARRGWRPVIGEPARAR